MITHLNTDEYWLEHGASGPHFSEGGEMMQKYLKMMGEKGAERKDTSIVPYNMAISAKRGTLQIPLTYL